MMHKTQTVAWMMVVAVLLLVAIVVILYTTKQTVQLGAQAGTITSTNLLKKS